MTSGQQMWSTEMKIESLMGEIESAFESAFNANLPSQKYREILQYWQKLANEQKLARERFALTSFIGYQAKKYSLKLSLVYVFQGKYFSTSINPIPGTDTTNELHEYAFPSAVWDAMGKVAMYPTGEVFSTDKVEDKSVTDRVKFIPIAGSKLSHLQK